MHSALYFIITVIFFHKYIYCYVIRSSNIDNNIEMLTRKLKKIYGIFPNHKFELQFDLEHLDYDGDGGETNNRHPTHAIMRSKNLSDVTITVTEASPTTTAKQVVYMDDLKKALEDYEKKHAQNDCNKKSPIKESKSLSSFNDNLSLSDILQLIKKGAILQNDAPKPDDADLGWIKIKVPAN